MKTGHGSEPSCEEGWMMEVLLCEGRGTLVEVTSQLLAKFGLHREVHAALGKLLGLGEGALSLMHEFSSDCRQGQYGPCARERPAARHGNKRQAFMFAAAKMSFLGGGAGGGHNT